MPLSARLALSASIILCFPAFALAREESGAEEPNTADIIVQATRSGRRVQDEPVRVEVIGREEIEEKILMRPGNVALILAETGGVRVQVTSPALGAANIRVQGMDGRFTQLLADGLPLYGGQASSLGLLQIPPTDLGQVEVIKGAASALYGPSALGGVINLVSRRPGDTPGGEVLTNVTTRAGQDLTAYAATPLAGGWSASLTGGFHRQETQDLDRDGWIDMPRYRRWTVRPRMYWDGDGGETLLLTAGAMTEQRRGGTLPGRTVPDGTPFVQAQDTDRLDAGLVAKLPLGEDFTAHLRAAAMTQKHRHDFGDVRENDRHGTIFGEASLSGKIGDTAWVGGLAWQEDRFRSRTFPDFDYAYRVPGVFAQLEQELGAGLTLAGSARADFHNEYGTQFSLRLSLLHRNGPWTIRASGGRGFFAPTAFVGEIEAAGLSRLEPVADLAVESAKTASLDVGYRSGPAEANVTLFRSNIRGATQLETVAPDRVRLINSAGQTRIRGIEALLRYRWDSFLITGSYVLVDASEPDSDGSGRRAMPLTPKHAAGLVAMWEEHDKGRLGLEIYYTGRQRLDDNPYRSTSKPYFEFGLLAEVVVGKARIFANAENILGTRQTQWDPLLRRSRAADGRWTVDVWAPTDGFVFNAGVKLRFGKED